MRPTVKRRYDGSGRRAQAEQTRRALLGAARDLLLADGYAATTIGQVAQRCGVSIESVYKRFPGKPALVRAVVVEALQGLGPVAAETRSDALPADDPYELVRSWGLLTAEVAPRVAPVLLLVKAAASHDRDLVILAGELDESRRARMTQNARRLSDSRMLRPGLSLTQAADVLWTYSSPELYDLLVLRSGWTVEEYGEFVADGLRAQLLG